MWIAALLSAKAAEFEGYNLSEILFPLVFDHHRHHNSIIRHTKLRVEQEIRYAG
jgi:hypothetical protein